MKVKDIKKYVSKNNIKSAKDINSKFTVGDVVIREGGVYEGKQIPTAISVIVEVINENEYRGDEIGLCNPDHIREPSMKEIFRYRPEISIQIDKT